MKTNAIRNLAVGALCASLMATAGIASAQRGHAGGSFRGGGYSHGVSGYRGGGFREGSHWRGGDHWRGGGGIGLEFGLGIGGPVYGPPAYDYDDYYGPSYVVPEYAPAFGADIVIGGGGGYYRGGSHYYRGGGSYHGGSSRGSYSHGSFSHSGGRRH